MNRLLLWKLLPLALLLALAPARTLAHAPFMNDLHDVVIGRSVSATQAQAYVYTDAFDLHLAASDLYTMATALKWSYEIVGQPKYAINGLDPVNSSLEDPVLTPDAKNINKTINPRETGELASNYGDGRPNTITIRNIRLAPFGKPVVNDPTPGLIDQQAVTFWCSNGVKATSSTRFFYTDNNAWGYNRIPSLNPCVGKVDFLTKPWPVLDGPYGAITTETMADGRGICFRTDKRGDNMASVQNAYGFFTLTPNRVYRIRAMMNSSQATPGVTPFWDFILENWSDRTRKGLNAYGMDAYFLDNEGGANSVVSTQNGTEFVMYWAPAPFRTQQWNDLGSIYSKPAGIYSPLYSASKDPYLRFRVMDIESNPALRSDQRFGSLCLEKVVVESIPFSQVKHVGAPYVSIGNCAGSTGVIPFKQAVNTAPGGNVFIKGLVGTAVAYAADGTYVTLTPNAAAAQSMELVSVQPARDLKGIDLNGGVVLAAPYNDILDDYPIPWLSNQTLMLEADLSAPNANSEAHPWDIMVMSMESATNEVACESYVTANSKIGTPRYGAGPQTYTMFFNTMNETRSAVPNFHNLRWRLRFANSSKLNWPSPSDSTNSGGVRIHRIAVTPVSVY